MLDELDKERYTNKLYEYMLIKARKIEEATGIKWIVEKEMIKFVNPRAKWHHIVMSILNDKEGLSASLCSFCVDLFGYVPKECCDNCGFAKKNGICVYDNSNYGKVKEFIYSSGDTLEQIFSNKWYIEILKEMGEVI